MRSIYFLLCKAFFVMVACSSCAEPNVPPALPPPLEITFPKFHQDSAYAFIAKQLSFGPRVPATAPHAACADWLLSKFEAFGWEVHFQEASVTGPDEQPLPIKNIIASLNTLNTKRVLLCAHWDTRAMADQDTVRKTEPILGADDGGSGVGILLELARVVGQQNIDLGIDIVLFDAEDQGESNSPRPAAQTWCLGAQYWSKYPHPMVKKPAFGILLDMVGFSHAQFPKEGVSANRAPAVQNAVWKKAQELGYNDLFVNIPVGDLVDDHLFVNDLAHIPTIDIINLSTTPSSRGRFGFYWHTHKDNMDIIGKHTLKAVGKTLLCSLYSHEQGILF